MEYYNNGPNFRIAIYIGGNIERRNGFGQIVSIGALAGDEYTKLDATPISRANTNENPVFTIKNTDTYVLYKIWDGSVLISDDMNNGRLCIGMTIPSNARMADSKQSPYTLLMAIHKTFLELGTEPTEDGRRRFKKVELKKEDFQAIIDRYPIVEDRNRIVEPMKGVRRGQLQITSDKGMEDFFRDTQYGEFSDYEAIEVTRKGLNMFPNLRIPKPKGYQVVVNGQPAMDPKDKDKKKILWEGSDEKFTARCASSLDYRYEPLYFSIEQLRKAPEKTWKSQDGNSMAVIDENSQSIICTLKPIQKWYGKEVRYEPKSDDDAKKYCKENLGMGIKIFVDGQEWTDKIMPSRIATEQEDGSVRFKADRVSISPASTGRYCFSVSKVEQDPYDGEKVRVYIMAKTNRGGGERRGNGGKPASGLDWKSLLIGAVIGILMGVVGFWAAQTLIDKNYEKELEKQEKTWEENKYHELPKGTPKTPGQAMQFRGYLREFSNGENVIKKGDSVSETIIGSFGYSKGEHINDAKKRLQTYVNDSIDAERAEDSVFMACTDIEACDRYLDAYNETHQYFENGKHVEEVLKKKQELEKIEAQEIRDQELQERKNKEAAIKKVVEQEALNYLNAKDLNGFRNWLDKNNEKWKSEFRERKANKDLLNTKTKKKTNWIDLILSIPSGPKRKDYLDYLNKFKQYKNKSFSSDDWNLIEQIATNIDNYKNGKIESLPQN